jgi:signal transduction histidine kinase
VSAHTEPLDPEALGWRHDHFSNVNIAGNDLRVLTRPIFVGDRLVGCIQIAGSLETVNKVSDTLLLLMVISCAIGMVGAGLISMWFSHRALKPIEDITRVTARIADTSELSTRLYWKGPPDELGRLISVFNKMMGRIEHAFNVQRRFVADMSHELRTPLTTIRGNLELGKRYGLDADAMAAMEIETERMSRLVSDLLMLARADYGGITIDLQPMDLELAVKLAVEESRALAIGRELDLSLESTVPARIKGNAERLKEVLRGLIGNAVKFTPDGGFIRVGLTATDDHATIHVRDSGIGIESDHIDHIFDRFYQADSARTHLGGFGLGLSIARWVVDAHGGSIEAESTPGDGATFRITLPLDKPEPADETPHSSPTRPRLPIIRRAPRDGQDGGLHDLEIVTSGGDEDGDGGDEKA